MIGTRPRTHARARARAHTPHCMELYGGTREGKSGGGVGWKEGQEWWTTKLARQRTNKFGAMTRERECVCVHENKTDQGTLRAFQADTAFVDVHRRPRHPARHGVDAMCVCVCVCVCVSRAAKTVMSSD
jgi:hypothetical protein